MDIEKIKLEALLLVLEINRLQLKTSKTFQNSYPENQIYQAIYQYYLKFETNKSFSLEEKDKLYQWAKENARYSLLETLIQMQINRLMYPQKIEGIHFNVVDHFILNNLDFLIQILLESAKMWIPQGGFHKIPITNVSKKETNKLIAEILIEIDPSLEWLKLYQKAYQQNRIIFVDELSQTQQEQIGKDLLKRGNICLVKEDGPYILIHRKETIEDIPSLLHEFIHYISYLKNPKKQIPRTLSEFPSLFYEFYTFSFLERKGYSKQEIDFIRNNRLENIISISPYVFTTCHYMSMFFSNHKITEELDIQAEQNRLLSLPKQSETLIQGYSFTTHNPKLSANIRCDKCIEQLIINERRFFSSYPYLIGKHLIEKIEQMSLSRQQILSKLKYTTDNLSSIDPTDIFQFVGYQLENFEQEQAEIKSLVL